MKKTYCIEVDCAACAQKVELAAGKTPGVKSAVVNFMGQKLIVEFEDGAEISEVMAQVAKNCRKATRDCVIYL